VERKESADDGNKENAAAHSTEHGHHTHGEGYHE
jgi:hypothetical protein